MLYLLGQNARNSVVEMSARVRIGLSSVGGAVHFASRRTVHGAALGKEKGDMKKKDSVGRWTARFFFCVAAVFPIRWGRQETNSTRVGGGQLKEKGHSVVGVAPRWR